MTDQEQTTKCVESLRAWCTDILDGEVDLTDIEVADALMAVLDEAGAMLTALQESETRFAVALDACAANIAENGSWGIDALTKTREALQ